MFLLKQKCLASSSSCPSFPMSIQHHSCSLGGSCSPVRGRRTVPTSTESGGLFILVQINHSNPAGGRRALSSLLPQMEGNVYGAAMAGGAFDLKSFLLQPRVIARIASWIFSIIVFGCITSEGYENAMTSEKLDCIFNQNVDACHYGVGIGVLAFFICIVFFALDVYFPQISNVNQRKHIVMADFGVSGVWTFLWFVGFCFLTNQWVSTINMPNIGADSARAAIAFSFFSIFSWGLLTAIAFKSYQTGVAEFSERYTDPSSDYPPYPNVAENYQQPFGNTTQPGTDEYHPPTY